MIPSSLEKSGIKLYGRKGWKSHLAAALGVDRATIFRIMQRQQVPGPYEVALRGLLEHKRRQDELDRAARALRPRKFRKKKTWKGKAKQKKLVPYAGKEPEA